MNIKRPFEFSFPFSEKARVWDGAEVVSEGKAVCSSCDRVVPLWEVFDGEYTYLIKECGQEDLIWKTLLHKGRWFPAPGKIENAPFYNIDIGESFDGSLDKVKGLEKVTTFVLRITNQCNTRCRVCLDRENEWGGEVRMEDLESSPLFYKRQIALSGGEPTTRGDLPEMIHLLKRKKNWVSICSNGLKLKDMGYLRRLRDNGLDSVLLSFNGFREYPYEKMGGGKEELSLKMKALENLGKLNISTILQVTLSEGINREDIPSLVKFSLEEDFIKGVWFKSIFLPGIVPGTDFSPHHLVSLETMRRDVAGALSLPENYFDLLYQAKEKILAGLMRLFPRVPVSQPQANQVILCNRGGASIPLLNEKELRSLLKGEVKFSYFRWFLPILKSGLSPLKLEKEILKKGVRINIGRSRGPRDIDLSRPICYLYLVSRPGKGWVISTGLLHITPQD